MPPLYLDLGPDQLALLIPIVAIVGAFLTSIIKSLIRHQRSMAELYHNNVVGAGNRDVDRLSQEMAELKALVHQQTIALDNFVSRQSVASTTPPAVSTDALKERIGS